MRSWLAVLALLFAVSAAYGVADRELAAKQSADAWLGYIDEGKYKEALEGSSPELRKSIDTEDWVSGLTQVRQPLGTVQSRTLRRLFPTTVLPGDIEGDFVVINYQTKFADSARQAEEILVMSPGPVAKDGKETWLVTSYYIE